MADIISQSSMDFRKKLGVIKKYLPNYYKIYLKVSPKLNDKQKVTLLNKYYDVALKHIKRNVDEKPNIHPSVIPPSPQQQAKRPEMHIQPAIIPPASRPSHRVVTPIKGVVHRDIIDESNSKNGGSNMATMNRPALQERIKDWIYDSYVPTTGTDATYFSTAIGGAKTLTYTNMTQGGQLPFSEKFRVIGIGAFITPLVSFDASTTDLMGYLQKIQTGNWSLKIMNKTYLQGSIASILAQNRIDASVLQASASDLSWVTLDAPFYKTYGYFPITGGEFTLNNGVNFSITVNWDEAVGADNPFRLYLVMFGLRFRPIQ